MYIRIYSPALFLLDFVSLEMSLVVLKDQHWVIHIG